MARFVSTPDTFFVEEVPAYVPCGEGTHTYLWIEKRGLTTPEAVKRIARELRVPDRDVGYAGMKDRHATTRQWLSVPGVDPAAALALAIDDLRVLEARRHGNKLRTGHLRGNRFEVVLTDVAPAEAPEIEAQLRRWGAGGIPNYYGDQRFGAAGDNVAIGLEILRGVRRERDARRRRFLLSAVQSAVFNRTLDLRTQGGGGLARVRSGDVLQKTSSGGVFVSDDRERDQLRVDAGEVVPTGPMPGGRAPEPPEGSEAWTLESEAFRGVGVGRDELAAHGRELPGTRRPVLVPVTLEGPVVVPEPEARLRLRFSLPAGSYATVLLQALGVLESRGPVVVLEAPPESAP